MDSLPINNRHHDGDNWINQHTLCQVGRNLSQGVGHDNSSRAADFVVAENSAGERVEFNHPIFQVKLYRDAQQFERLTKCPGQCDDAG